MEIAIKPLIFLFISQNTESVREGGREGGREGRGKRKLYKKLVSSFYYLLL